MKLKYKIFSIFLSFSFCFISIFNSSTIVYAKTYYSWNEFIKDTYTYITYIASQIGAVCSFDFAQWIQNKDSWDNYWNEDNITFDNDNGNVIFSDDLVNYIKQALKEYAEETNGYIILPSIHFSTISPSSFGSSYQYQTAKALVNEYGLVGLLNYSSTMRVYSFSEYLNNTAGFYVKSEYSTYNYLNYEDLLKWSHIDYSDNCIEMNSKFEKIIHNWDEAKSSASPSDGLYYYSASNGKNYGTIVIHKPGYAVYSNNTNCKLVSKDGRNILVFKNKAALENYTVDHRTVYFGSKFYEDTGSVTGSWDDLQDWLDGKYDDFWDKLKDLLPEGSNLSEDELEKLIDKLLDQLGEVGDKIDEGNKETNNLLQKILDALNKLDSTVASAFSGSRFDTSGIEAYLARILADLDYIVYNMEETSEEEFTQKTNDMFDEVQMTFADLGEIAKTKFPLSIPWDIDALLGFLGGKNSDSSPKAVVFDSFDSDDFIIIDTSSNNEISIFTAESGDGDDEGHGGGGGSDHTGNDSDKRLSVYIADVLSSSGAFMSSDGDPIFALPFLVSKSLDIKGTIYINMFKFKFVSQLGRTLFTCIFAMYLIRLTFNVVSLGKDVFE